MARLGASLLLWLNVAVAASGLLKDSSQQSFLAKSALAKAAKADTSTARAALNSMYAEAVAERDLLELDCRQALGSSKEQIKTAARRLADFATDVANARASIAEAQQSADEAKVSAESLAHEGRQRVESCRATHESLAAQRELLMADAENARKVQEGASCDASLLLMECKDGAESFLALGGQEEAAAALSPAAKQAAKKAIAAAVRPHALVRKAGQPAEEAPPAEPVPVAEHYPTGSRRKCSVAGSANCPALHDALAQLTGEAQDALSELDGQLGTLEAQCNDVEKQAHDQHQAWVTKAEKSNVELALATKHLNEASEHERLGRNEKKALHTREQELRQECAERRKAVGDTMCGVQSLRLELLQMNDEEVEIQDCQVGEWVPGACSATCGGGEMTLMREVLTPAENGADCPPLQVVRQCGMEPCGSDCEMEDWSGWSECSKDCGGGVRQRVRITRHEAQHGGAPCPAAQEEEVCNVQPCDQACQYAPWSEWSGCSQQCGGGWRTKTRAVLAEAVGTAPTCAAVSDPERLQPEVCNEQECPEDLKCASELDLVVLMDASGSVDTAGFTAEKAAVKRLLGRRLQYGDGFAKAGIAVFGGDVTEVHALTATQDAGALEAAVDGAAQGTAYATNLAPALERAANMLHQGRTLAPSVILVLLQGMPADMRAAAEAAKHITQQARIVVAPVGPGVDYDRVAQWASFPARLNVLALNTFEALGTSEPELSRFVAALCPLAEEGADLS